MNLFKYYENCRLCPRQCEINRIKARTTGKTGFCGETDQLRIGFIGPHFGEEPPISGSNGSGTVFLSGCSLQCSFCQNQQISHEGMGRPVDPEHLILEILQMVKIRHVHNINFVTPDHFFPHIFHLISLSRQRGLYLPIVYNTSGYQSTELLKVADDYADIYLPDFKYSDSSLAATLSKCPDYPSIALEAISIMIRQKGFLDTCRTGAETAKRGVLVRHLIIPGHVENSINALTSLYVEFGRQLPVSLMSQYHPVGYHNDNDLNRLLSEEEFNLVYSHARNLGFENLFFQFLENNTDRTPMVSPFLPDFRQKDPFK
jgi:putative pyruvate formate lyase activating enzyme